MRWLALPLLCLYLPVALAKTILVVESYHAGFKWDQDYRRALSEALTPGHTLEFFEMDTKRLAEEKHAAMGQKAVARIKKSTPALVVMGDDAALKYVGPELDRLGIPGVYLGINNNPRNYVRESYGHITGVLERPLIKRNVAFIQQLVPAIQKVQILFDGNFTSEVIRNEVFGGKLATQLNGIQIDLKICKTVNDWKQAVRDAQSNGYQITVVGLYQALTGPNNRIANDEDIITWTSAHTPVPLFAIWDFSVGPDKAIGGLVMTGAEQGKAAASIVRKILENKTEPARIFPQTTTLGSFVFSRKQLARFGIRLPSEIANRAKLTD